MACAAHPTWSIVDAARRLVLLSGALLLAACVHYEPKPLDAGVSAKQFASRTLDDPALREQIQTILVDSPSPWPLASWNRAQLLAAALSLNPKLAIARDEVQSSLAHEITAGEMPNPDLTLQSEYAKHDPHPWLYGLGLDVLLRTPERKRLDIDQARLDVSNARWDLMNEAWSIRHALLAALSDRESALRRSVLLDQLAAAQNALYDIEQRRIAAGEDAPDALLVSGQARIEIEQQQVQARTDLATANAALASALGVPSSAISDLRIDWPEWGDPPAGDSRTLSDLREQALLSRSDLAAAIGAYAIAENKLHQAILQQYPQFHFLPGYYWDHGISKYPFDVSFGLPFNRNRGEIAEATAQRDVEGKRMVAMQAGIFSELDTAEHGEQIARDGVEAALRGLDATRQQQRQAELGQRLGSTGASESTAARILALRSELETLQMRTQLQNARNAFEDALHTPLSGPELALSKPLPVAIAGTKP